jgi:hypothetical protein
VNRDFDQPFNRSKPARLEHVDFNFEMERRSDLRDETPRYALAIPEGAIRDRDQKGLTLDEELLNDRTIPHPGRIPALLLDRLVLPVCEPLALQHVMSGMYYGLSSSREKIAHLFDGHVCLSQQIIHEDRNIEGSRIADYPGMPNLNVQSTIEGGFVEPRSSALVPENGLRHCGKNNHSCKDGRTLPECGSGYQTSQ